MAVIKNKFLFFESVENFERRLANHEILDSSIAFVCETVGSGSNKTITPRFIWAQGMTWETNFEFDPSVQIGSATKSGSSTNTSISVTTTNGKVSAVNVEDSYTADSSTHYLTGATSLKDADKKLDTALYNLSVNNTIQDNDVIDATPGTGSSGTTLEVKVDNTTIEKEYISGNSGLKQLKTALKLGWNASLQRIELQDKNGNAIDNGGVLLSTILSSEIITNNVYDETTGKLRITFKGGSYVDIELLKLLDINDASVKDGSESYLEVVLESNPAAANENSETQFQIGVKKCNLADAAPAQGQTAAVTGLVDALDAKTYIDNSISTLTSNSLKKVNGDGYVSVSAPSNREQNITTNVGTLSVSDKRLTGATNNTLATTSNVQSAVNNLIESLDKPSTSVTSTAMSSAATSPGFAEITYKQDDAIVTVESLELKVGDLDSNTEGLTTVSDVRQYVNDITGGANQWKAGTGTNTAILKNTTASSSTGTNSIVGGTSPTITGNNSIISGTSSSVSGNNSIAVGNTVSVANANEAAFGYFNSSVSGTGQTQDEINSGTTVFTVGVGASSLSPQNALDIRRNGDILILYSGTSGAATTLQSLLHNEIDWYVDTTN